MSTRCNIIIKDKDLDDDSFLIFYRHCDGYPEGVAETLGEFLELVKTNRLRDNVEQAAGWLIMLGNEEYAKTGETLASIRANTKGTNLKFKVGAYEPSTCIHGDIEYLYEIDLTAKTLRGWEHDGEKKGKEITKTLLNEIEKALSKKKAA